MTRSAASWRVPLALVIVSLVPMIGGIVRIEGIFSGDAGTPASARFVASPIPIVVHLLAAAIYSIAGAFQFSSGARRRWPAWHRRAGRVLVVLGMLAALSGVWMAATWDIPRSMQGPLLMVVRVVVGVAMASALILGVRAILRGDVPSHEAWMIRAYALGQGAGAQVLWLGVPSIFVGEILGWERDLLMTSAWVGNLLLGEWIIRRRYAPKRSRTIAPAALSTGS